MCINKINFIIKTNKCKVKEVSLNNNCRKSLRLKIPWTIRPSMKILMKKKVKNPNQWTFLKIRNSVQDNKGHKNNFKITKQTTEYH